MFRDLREGLAEYVRLEREVLDNAKAVEATRAKVDEASARAEFPEDIGAAVDEWFKQAKRNK